MCSFRTYPEDNEASWWTLTGLYCINPIPPWLTLRLLPLFHCA